MLKTHSLIKADSVISFSSLSTILFCLNESVLCLRQWLSDFQCLGYRSLSPLWLFACCRTPLSVGLFSQIPSSLSPIQICGLLPHSSPLLLNESHLQCSTCDLAIKHLHLLHQFVALTQPGVRGRGYVAGSTSVFRCS